MGAEMNLEIALWLQKRKAVMQQMQPTSFKILAKDLIGLSQVNLRTMSSHC